MSDDVLARLAEIEQRANAATEGPWTDRFESWAGKGAVLNGDGHPVALCGADLPENGYYQATNDQAFIAHARADVPWLIEQLRAGTIGHAAPSCEAEAAIDRVRDLHKPYGKAGKQRCSECWDPAKGHLEAWPCPTIRAVDGDSSTTTDERP